MKLHKVINATLGPRFIPRMAQEQSLESAASMVAFGEREKASEKRLWKNFQALGQTRDKDFRSEKVIMIEPEKAFRRRTAISAEGRHF